MIDTLSFVWGGCCSGQCNNHEGTETVTEKKVAYVGQRLNCSEETSVKSQSFSSLNSSTFSLIRMIGILSFIYGIRGQSTDPFPAQFELSSLNGADGFIIEGCMGPRSCELGISLSSMGDFNRDGIDDFVIGAWLATPSTIDRAGIAYILYGSQKLSGLKPYDLETLNTDQGLVIEGEKKGDRLGKGVYGNGDFNGDGYNDLFVTAYLHDLTNAGDVGRSYIFFGNRKNAKQQVIKSGQIGIQDGLIINGERGRLQSGIWASYAGDYNGDELDDLLISARKRNSVSTLQSETLYVIYGRNHTSNNSIIELNELNGQDGFKINFDYQSENLGKRISGVGDLNSDGFDDIAISYAKANTTKGIRTGQVFILFGQNISNQSSINLSTLDRKNLLYITGETNDDQLGGSGTSTIGDINGDNIDDLITSARNKNNGTGIVYVLLGKTDIGRSKQIHLNSLTSSDGFEIHGEYPYDHCCEPAKQPIDINGDDWLDIVIAARHASPSGKKEAGKIYIIYGHPHLAIRGPILLSQLNQSTGMIINGKEAGDRLGIDVTNIGDINGDGIDDLGLGAYYASVSGQNKAGKVYVIYGRQISSPITADFPNTPFISMLQSQETSTNSSMISTNHSTNTTYERKNPAESNESDSTSKYISIAISVTLLAGSILIGGVFYLKRRGQLDHPNEIQEGDSVPQNPNSEYMILSQALPPISGYEDWPSKEKPQTIEHYKKHRLSQLNRNQDEYLEAKFQDAHANYDDIPEL